MAHFRNDILSLLNFPKGGDLSAQRTTDIEAVEPLAIPEPYRSLLVHERDMTGTLGAFWNSKIELRPLRTHRENEVLYRQVVLMAVEKGLPVEAGAIQIFLNRFPLESLPAIVESRRPLGAILAESQIAYVSSPQGYFRILTNDFLREAFGDVAEAVHYGRRNRLEDPSGGVLAEVVEILPVIENR
jgi:hypothetical protein